MSGLPQKPGAIEALTTLPNYLLFLALFAAVTLTHLALLRLPYYWDEGGYYIPAALDFYRRWTLIPQFTNAHPPLPNVVLGLLWHVTGYHILATRLCVCAFAAAALLAVFRLTQRLLDPAAALAVTALTAVYPIWFAQSTLAHADIFAAAFTLAAFAIYLPSRFPTTPSSRHALWRNPRVAVAVLFTLSALSKETAILQPAAFATLEIFLLIQGRLRQRSIHHVSWLPALSFPALPLAAWYAYHHHKTGFTFGNPEYLRYNATANLTTSHILQALHYRFLHLAWQRNIWLPIILTLASFLLIRPAQKPGGPSFAPSAKGGVSPRTISVPAAAAILLLIAANWLAFSIFGGALLTRYLLPIYPLILILCVATWKSRTRHWLWLAALTAAAFLSAIWLNPPTSFAPEDNLTYRDMIVVHQQAVDYVAAHYPDATVLTAWPVSADLFNPDLGYTSRSIKVFPADSFSAADIAKASAQPGRFDTAILFTQHYITPQLLHYLQSHLNTTRARDYEKTRELTAAEIARLLGGRIVWQNNINGEWAAVVRFNRSYEAQLR